MIKSISYEQEEIIQNIMTLYCFPDGIECDPTYSKGVFYKNLPKPRYKFDLNPQLPEVNQADCRNLPLGDSSIRTLMFDPPFLGGGCKKGNVGKIPTRFGNYWNIPALWSMYLDALKEFYRVLKPNGILIFKCQDTVSDHKQWFSEFKIIKEALALGFYPKDKFILLAKHRLTSPNQMKQQHSRKFHSYFLVFIKTKSKVEY